MDQSSISLTRRPRWHVLQDQAGQLRRRYLREPFAANHDTVIKRYRRLRQTSA